MNTVLNPYLSFKNNAREAMQFYQSVFGGKLDLATFKDYHMTQNPAEENLIMHSMLVTGAGLTLMGADTPASMEQQPNGGIALSGDNYAELKGFYDKLTASGKVNMPLDKAPWGDYYGDCTDQYGVHWLINITAAK
jgi:PhnB protein